MLEETDCFEVVSSKDSGGWPDPLERSPGDRQPSLLIVGPSVNRAEMAAMAAGAGLRVLGAVSLEDLPARLSRTVGADGIIVDLRGLGGAGPRLDTMAAALLGWPGWCDAHVLLLVDAAGLEATAAALSAPFDRMLCDPALSDIGLGLCLLAREGRSAPYLHDINRDSEASRLDRLSEEVRRLAHTIDRLAHRETDLPAARAFDSAPEPAAPLPFPAEAIATPPAQGVPEGEASRSDVRALLQARRLRDRFLPSDLFADPAWDMILDLMAARLDGKRVSVSSLCIAAAVPPTTALRWIAQLTERGIFHRNNDPDDARRVFISLSDEAAERFGAWFNAVRRTGLRFAG